MARSRPISLLAAICVILAACGGSSTSPAATTGASGSGAPAGQRVAIDYWAFDEGGEAAEFQKAVEREFETDHPDIDLVATFYPEDGFDIKLETAIAAGQPPDLAPVFGYYLMKSGDLLALDDRIAESGLDLSTFNQGIFSEGGDFACVFEGKVYCLGSSFGGTMIVYNKSMFDAANIPHPDPWPAITPEQFYDYACRLTNEANGVYGAAVTDPMAFLPWEAVVSPDGRTAVGYVNSASTVQIFDGLAKAFQGGCVPSSDLMDPYEQGSDWFTQGKLAMMVNDNAGLKEIEAAGIEYGATAVPTPEGLEPYFWTFTYSTAILAGSEHPDEAFEFLHFLATDGQRLEFELSDGIPLDTKVQEEVDWAGGKPGREEMLEVLSHARAPVFIPEKWDVYGPIYDAWGLMVGGEQSAQQALDEAAPLIQENLDGAWEEWDAG
jgi:multiple sugar transport system substrate-binding protein